MLTFIHHSYKWANHDNTMKFWLSYIIIELVSWKNKVKLISIQKTCTHACKHVLTLAHLIWQCDQRTTVYHKVNITIYLSTEVTKHLIWPGYGFWVMNSKPYLKACSFSKHRICANILKPFLFIIMLWPRFNNHKAIISWHGKFWVLKSKLLRYSLNGLTERQIHFTEILNKNSCNQKYTCTNLFSVQFTTGSVFSFTLNATPVLFSPNVYENQLPENKNSYIYTYIYISK